MEFTIKKSDLLDVLQVTRVVGQSFLPITEGVLLKVDDISLKATCTNLEIVYSRSVTISSMPFAKEESLVLPAKKLLEVVRQMPDVPLVFVSNDNFSMTIKYGQNSINLKGYDVNDYPELPKTEAICQFKVSSKDLQRAIKVVAPAISNDNSRPIFTGILFEINKESIAVIATDGYRLHTDIVKTETNIEKNTQVIVPGKSIKEIQDLEGNINVCICDGYISFSNEKAIVTIRLISGIYPEYKRLIPSEFTTEIRIGVQEVIGALNRAKPIAEEANFSAIIYLSISTNSLQIMAKSESGELNEDLKPTEIKGEPLEISFNLQYLLNALKTTLESETKEAMLKFTGAESSCIIVPITGTSLCLVLPTRKKS